MGGESAPATLRNSNIPRTQLRQLQSIDLAGCQCVQYPKTLGISPPDNLLKYQNSGLLSGTDILHPRLSASICGSYYFSKLV
tara:strand:- start:205 stop:450 length:246 start_codon:yes stop_codon:yes gene_type:complete